MVKTTATVGHGTHPSGPEKMHYTCASSKASTLASSQKQQQSRSGASSMITSPKIVHEPEEESQDGKPIVDRKEILYAVTSRLDKILKRCNTFEHYKKNVTNLAKFTRKAVENNQGTVVQLTLADMRAVQDEIKANLSIWCDSIEGKIVNLDKKQNKILETMANIGEWVDRLQAVAKEIESHIGKVTNATDKLTSNPTPYQDALLEGTGRMGRDVVDGRILYEIERKAKQILIDFKDNKTAMISTEALIDKANGIIASIEDGDRPENTKVESITRFLKGGALLHLNSREAAHWLWELGIEEVFLQKFTKNASVREKQHHILLRRVPITFDPGNDRHLQEIEEANELLKYLLLKARWIKPEGRRQKGQTHAHAMAVIGMAEAANCIIRDELNTSKANLSPKK